MTYVMQCRYSRSYAGQEQMIVHLPRLLMDDIVCYDTTTILLSA